MAVFIVTLPREQLDQVEADFASIEDGGVLVLWKARGKGRDMMIRAYAHQQWFSVDVEASQEPETQDQPKPAKEA